MTGFKFVFRISNFTKPTNFRVIELEQVLCNDWDDAMSKAKEIARVNVYTLVSIERQEFV